MRRDARPLGRAIAIVDQLENLYRWLDEGKPVTQAQIEAQTQLYQLALERLARQPSRRA
jgi:hypothetical protein